MVGRVYVNNNYPGNIIKDNRNVNAMFKDNNKVWRFPARTTWIYEHESQLPSGTSYNDNDGYYERNGKRISEVGILLHRHNLNPYIYPNSMKEENIRVSQYWEVFRRVTRLSVPPINGDNITVHDTTAASTLNNYDNGKALNRDPRDRYAIIARYDNQLDGKQLVININHPIRHYIKQGDGMMDHWTLFFFECNNANIIINVNASTIAKVDVSDGRDHLGSFLTVKGTGNTINIYHANNSELLNEVRYKDEIPNFDIFWNGTYDDKDLNTNFKAVMSAGNTLNIHYD